MTTPSDFSEVLSALDLKQIESIKLINGNLFVDKYSLSHSSDEHALYVFNGNKLSINSFFGIIESQFSSDFELWILYKKNNLWQKYKLNIGELKDFNADGEIFIYFEPYLENASLLKFKELIAHLRSPDGCPWDLNQTHKTLRTNLLEEAYEVLESIDSGDLVALKEELGDLLLQIVLHAQIATEHNDFNIFDVIQGIHKKIVSRHPHVFQDADIKNPTEVIRNWEILKEKERKDNGGKNNILSGVPINLPALSLSQKYQERAARVGFDWPDIKPVFDKVNEEISELMKARSEPDAEMELGDLLFSVVNLARWYGYEAESLLRETSLRFKNRFEFIENQAAKDGKHLYELTLEEMNALWEKAKAKESTAE